MSSSQVTKEKIIETVSAMIDSETDIDKITVRKIAELAGVGTGLINYHFRTKDNLLASAIEKRVDDVVAQISVSPDIKSLDPAERMISMLDTIYELSEAHEELAKFMLKMEIRRGSMQVPLYMIQILKELFQNKKDELELRIIALQIFQPLQIAIMSKESFKIYSGVDIYRKEDRKKFIEALVYNVTGETRRN